MRRAGFFAPRGMAGAEHVGQGKEVGGERCGKRAVCVDIVALSGRRAAPLGERTPGDRGGTGRSRCLGARSHRRLPRCVKRSRWLFIVAGLGGSQAPCQKRQVTAPVTSAFLLSTARLRDWRLKMNVGSRTGQNSGRGDESMGEKADLETKAVKALGRYREALARAEELEQEEAAACRKLVEWRGRVEIAILEGCGSPARSHLAQTGQASISRLHEVRFAVSEATAALDSAYKALTALDDALGYIPIPPTRIRPRRDSSSGCGKRGLD